MRSILTIAGSDSCGGAGLQADLKVFAAYGLHGACAVTCITSQNTRGVRDVFPVPSAVIGKQLAAVFEDLDIAAVKSGVLGSVAAVEAVAEKLQHHALPYVLDPVTLASTGAMLGDAGTLDECVSRLSPLATVAPPIALEPAALTGATLRDREDAAKAGRALLGTGANAVLVKGGHLADDPGTDVLVTAEAVTVYPGELIVALHTHGTGCTLASAMAAGLALGWPLPRAIVHARDFTQGAIRGGYSIGSGAGPVDPLFLFRRGGEEPWPATAVGQSA